MMKRVLCLMLALMLCLPAGLAAAEAGQWTINTDRLALTQYNGAGGDVVIPAVVDGWKVMSLADNLFNNNDTITSVVIPEGCVAIGNAAFYDADELLSVTLPETLQAIDTYAFFLCESLREVRIPAGVGYMGDHAFSSCDSLTSVTFEGHVPVFGGRDVFYWNTPAVFYVPDDCLDEYRAALGDSYTIVSSGRNAVERTCDFTDYEFDAATGTLVKYNGLAAVVEIPETIDGVAVTAIGPKAFYFNSSVYRLTIPEGVTTVGESAFDGCGKLAAIQFPATLKTIGERAFYGFKGANLALPKGLETIGKRAFGNNTQLRALILPEGLKVIEDEAFYNSYRLEEVRFPATIEKIGERAFAKTNINYLVFYGCDMPEMAENSFEGDPMTKLKDVDMAWNTPREKWEAATALFDSMGFADVTVWRMNPQDVGLCTVAGKTKAMPGTYKDGLLTACNAEIPDVSVFTGFDGVDVYGVAEGCFKGNRNIRSFYPHHCDWFTTIGNEAFAGSTLAYIDLFDSITTIGEGAFRDCAELTELTIPASVTAIGENAFAGCTGLETVTVLCAPELIPEGSFAGVENVYLAADVSDEAVEAFSARLGRAWYKPALRVGEEEKALIVMPNEPTDASLFEFDAEKGMITAYTGRFVDVVIPREIGGVTVRAIRDNAFDGCRDYTDTDVYTNQTDWVPLRTLVIPETVEIIEDRAFSYCQQLENVVCYAPLTTTGRSTFLHCTNLQNVSFVNGVWKLDNYLFESCASLKTVYAGQKLQSIGNSCFVLSGIEEFVVDAKEVANFAFGRCANLKKLHFTARVEKAEAGAVNDCPSLTEVCVESDSAQFLARDGMAAGAASAVTLYVPATMSDEEAEYARKRLCVWDFTPTEVTVVRAACDRAPAEPVIPDFDALEPYEYVPASAEQQPPEAAPIGEEYGAYFGTWYAMEMSMGDMVVNLADYGLNITYELREDGTFVMSNGEEREGGIWTAEDGAVKVETMTAALTEDGRLRLSEDDEALLLSRSAPQVEPIGEEYSAFFGTWYAVELNMGGMVIDAADFGMEMIYTLNADGTYEMSDGYETETGVWTAKNGEVKLTGMSAAIGEDGRLCLREGESAVILSRGEGEEAQPIPDPAVSAQTGAGIAIEQKYVCKTVDVSGMTLDASILGGEYSFLLHADDTADLLIAGVEMKNLVCKPTEEGLNVDMYGSILPVTYTETGFDMDYFETMLLHFVPAE